MKPLRILSILGMVALSSFGVFITIRYGNLSAYNIWLKALIICLIHFLAPLYMPWVKKNDAIINSFAGGMAVAYVFGYLLPEIDAGHEKVGDLIYLIILVGFILYY